MPWGFGLISGAAEWSFPMVSIAIVLAFVAVLAAFNRFEFGRFD